MPDERRVTISSGRMTPDDVARHSFATTRRGFAPGEVRAFLEAVGRELQEAAAREQQLRDELADAERRAANPVLDEETLTNALGQETARVLRSAHDAASDVVARAEADAARLRDEAAEESEALRAAAEQAATDRTEHAEQSAAEVRRRAHEDATTRVETARTEAEALLVQARAECRAMVQEAQELRTRVLGDLNRRRRVLHSQIEQLRAGRERLAETINDVRADVNRIADDLFRAEDEARLAAEGAARQAAGSPEPGDAPEGAARSGVAEGAGAVEDAGGAGGAGAVEGAGRDGAGEGGARPGGAAEGPEAGPADDDERKPAVSIIGPVSRAGDEAAVGAALVDTGETPAVSGAGPASASAPSGDAGSAPDGDEGGPRPPDSVEELFARLRAEREAGAPPVAPEEVGAGEPVTGAAPAGTSETPAAGADGGSPGADGDADAAERDARLVRRDELLGPVTAGLARRLKRALQDDQNDVLDRLRHQGRWDAGVLPTEEEQLERYRRAAREHLAEAARAGARYAGARPADEPDVDEAAAELATALVGPLRRRLDVNGAAEGDMPALIEHLGAAFREWKGARIQRLAGDQAVAAFSSALLASTAEGTQLEWVVDDDGGNCSDCDDNALAGGVVRGEAYPTGHLHPPVHAGCRCLVAPAAE